MYEFYGGVLGFKQLSTLNVGNGGGVARFQAGAQELKLTRRVSDKEIRERRRARCHGLEAADVLLRRRGRALGAFRGAWAWPRPSSRTFEREGKPSGARDGSRWSAGGARDRSGATAEQLASIEVGLTVADSRARSRLLS